MIGKIREFSTRGPEWARAKVMRGALKFKEFAKDGCPVDTGRLRDSIGEPTKEGIFDVSAKGLSISVGTKISYAGIVDKGIPTPYTIVGKKSVLRWIDKSGKVHFAWRVRHPPFKGKFFMENAAVRTREFLQHEPTGGIA